MRNRKNRSADPLSADARRYAAEDSAFWSYVNRWGERDGIDARQKAAYEKQTGKAVNLSNLRLAGLMADRGAASEQELRDALESDDGFKRYKEKFLSMASAEDYSGNSPTKTGNIDDLYALEDAFDDAAGNVSRETKAPKAAAPKAAAPKAAAPKAAAPKAAAPRAEYPAAEAVRGAKAAAPRAEYPAAEAVRGAGDTFAGRVRRAGRRVAAAARRFVKRLFG